MVPPGLRRPRRLRRARVRAQELVDALVDTGVVDVQLVCGVRICGPEAGGGVPGDDAVRGDGCC
jgi:hypothetical protein